MRADKGKPIRTKTKTKINNPFGTKFRKDSALTTTQVPPVNSNPTANFSTPAITAAMTTLRTNAQQVGATREQMQGASKALPKQPPKAQQLGPKSQTTTKASSPLKTTINQLPCQPVTPIKPDVLKHLLTGYPTTETKFLVEGFTYGFKIPFSGPYPPKTTKNLASAFQHSEVIENKIAKEVSKGRIAGPFDNPPFEPFIVSPLGVVPKKTPGAFRIIHHESYPFGSSLNAGIPKDLTSVKYATVLDVISDIKRVGKGSFLAKTDIVDAFWLVPLHPDSHHLMGIFWEGKYYFYKNLSMGCSYSPALFERFSTAIEWIAREKFQINNIHHVLDDFCIVQACGHSCQSDLQNFENMCASLGIPLSPEKTCGPSTCLPFLGIELDSVVSEARLPTDKIQKCLRKIAEFYHRNKVTLKELQSLVGLLNFACSVVPGRAFLRRLINLMEGVKHPMHHIRITAPVRADLKVWETFLEDFNGKSFFIDETFLTSPDLLLFTDAAASLGYSGIYGRNYFYGAWPSNMQDLHIQVLELYPIMLAVHMYGHLMSNHSVTFMSDNQSVVYVVNKMSSKDKWLMTLIRPLVLACLKHNILFRARFLPGAVNTNADLLSRLKVEDFKKNVGHAVNPEPDEIPQHLRPEILFGRERPNC